MVPPPPHLTLSPAPLLHQLSSLATATVSPDSSWYRPTPTHTRTPLKEGEPDSTLNKTSFLDTGQITGTGKYRDVIWFDLSAYNTSDKITSSILSLFWYYPENSGRNQSMTVEIYRPLSWDPDSVNWKNRSYGTPWTNPGGDWFDRNDAAQGSVPFASITFNASTIPDNKYYDFNVTDLVQSYVSGTYNNTGFFLKAKDENDNYIAFYSVDHSNPDQRPKLVINYTTGGACSPNDIDCNGVVNEADLEIIRTNFGQTTHAPYPSYDVIGYGIVDIYDIAAVSRNI